MWGNIVLLQGIALLVIKTCNGQIQVGGVDNSNLKFKLDVPGLEKIFKEHIANINKEELSLKLNVSELEKKVNAHFDGIKDKDVNVKLNINELQAAIPHFQKFLRKSNAKKLTLADAITEIDNKLKDGKGPCIDLDPPRPDFQSQGHRISQARCLDYIWDTKLEEERVKRSETCRGQKEHPGAHIISGHKVHSGDYPHMGAVGWAARSDRWIFLCGSSLISHKFVLTAAHCHSVSRSDRRVTYHKPKIVRFGVVNIMTDRHNVDIEIRRFISHPKYNYTVKYYDIALIELEDVVRSTRYIRPACLWNKYSLLNTRSAAVTGWGVIDLSLNSQRTSAEMQVAHIDIIESKQCGNMLKMKEQRDWWGVKRHQLCATKLNGTAGACEGDSGGPLQIKLSTNTIKPVHSIIAVTSVGFGCGRTRFPSIYTRVSTFIDWIESEIWGVQNDSPVPATVPKSYRYSHSYSYNYTYSSNSSSNAPRRHDKHRLGSHRHYRRNFD